jgi:hypothetical protein
MALLTAFVKIAQRGGDRGQKIPVLVTDSDICGFFEGEVMALFSCSSLFLVHESESKTVCVT